MSGVVWTTFGTALPYEALGANSGWNMADSMAAILADHTKKILTEARFYTISADEVTIVDHES